MFSSLFLFLSIFWILTKTQSTLYGWSESFKCQSIVSLSWCLVLIRYILMCREMVARLPSGVHLTSGARSHMNIQEYKVKPCPELSRVAACCPELSLSLSTSGSVVTLDSKCTATDVFGWIFQLLKDYENIREHLHHDFSWLSGKLRGFCRATNHLK